MFTEPDGLQPDGAPHDVEAMERMKEWSDGHRENFAPADSTTIPAFLCVPLCPPW
jgi:hypothetical protein